MRPSTLDFLGTFADVADRYSDHPAIEHAERTLSYAELSSLVHATASRLGPRPGVVGVPATHSPETVVALLGVLAAGGAYCPVDPAYPSTRQRAMLAAAGCTTVLDPADVRLSSGPPAGIVGDAEDPAYLLFTSGSTGEPKPVVTPRRAISVVVESLRELFDLTPADRVLQFASLNWDTCFEEILPTLTTGATLVFDDEAYTGSFPRFLRMVARRRVTVLDLPTAFWHELVHYLTDLPGLPNHLRLVIIGGEAASPARLADWGALDTGRIRLLNTYGCTETTLITHAVDLHGPLAAGAGWDRVPIGRALPHVIERIDQGELLIGGRALALGYRDRPAETAARFVTDAKGDKYFRTGDRVSARPDGLLVHEGRLDGELKVRGIRVDPAEVEAHIASHPSVGSVAVVGVGVADHTALVA